MSRPRTRPLDTYAELSAKLSYDPDTGAFMRTLNTGIQRPAPTYEQNAGYQMIYGVTSMYLAHRVAWLLHHGEWPTTEIDHRDGNKSNNRISNLRVATRSENMTHRAIYNPTGRKGVKKLASGLYEASITTRGERNYLGRFQTVDEAGDAYDAAAVRAHGEWANTRVIIRGSISATITFNTSVQ